MKKLLSIMLAALIVLSCLVVPVYAEGPMKVRLSLPDSYEYGTDNAIVAEIYLENNTSGVSAGTFYIDLPECLTTETENPEESINMMVMGYFATGGWASDGEHRLSFGFMGTRAFKGDQLLLTINLVPTPDATKEEIENMKVVLGIREFKTGDNVTHTGEDEDVQIAKDPIEIPSVSCTHPETEEVGAKDPTCTEPGNTAGKICKFCGAALGNTQQTPALGHDWKFDSHKKEATCSTEGIDIYKCTRCSETEERPVGKTAHTPSTDYKHDDAFHWTYCTVCGEQIGEKVKHTPDTAWHNEDASVDGHYHVCSVCKAAVGVEEHVDKDTDGECDVCEAALHEHIADTSKWLYDDEGHYHACTVPGCKAPLDKEAHKLETKTDKEATCTEKGSETTYCTVCDYKETKETEMIPHTPDTEWHTEKGSDMHWHICTVCGNKIEDTAVAHTYGEYTSTETDHTQTCTACGATKTEKHSGGEATCTKLAVCEACGKEYGELDPDNHADGLTGVEWENDENGHWQTCKNCGKTTEPAEHKKADDYKTDGENHWSYCTVCGYEYEKTAHATTKGLTSDSTGHWKTCDECEAKFEFDPHTKAILVSEKEATAEADGNTEYWYCPDCQKYFYNDNGKIGKGPYDNADEFTVKFKQTCQGNHDFICVPVNDAYHKFVCRRCGYSISTQHDIAANGLCFYCGHRSTTVNTNTGVVEVESPTELKISAETLEIVR